MQAFCGVREPPGRIVSCMDIHMIRLMLVYCTECLCRNTAQVTGGERELRTNYLKPFNRACVEAFSIMTAYSSYDGIPAIANKREGSYCFKT